MITALHAQYEVLDSTERAYLLSVSPERNRVDTLNEWAYNSTGIKARTYAMLALRIAEQLGYVKGRGDSYARLGKIARESGDLNAASNFIQKALVVRDSLKDSIGMVSCYIYLGDFQEDFGNYKGASDFYQKGLALMKDKGPHINTAYLYNCLGRLNRAYGRYEETLGNFQACMRTYGLLKPLAQSDAEQRSIMRGLATARLNLAAFSQDHLRQLSAAKDSLLKCMADFRQLNDKVNLGKTLVNLGNNAYYSGDLDNAAGYYDQGLSLGKELNPNDYYILLKNRAKIDLDRGDYKKALINFQTSLDSFLILENFQEISATRFEIGNYHYEKSEFDSAAHYYKLALDSNLTDPLLKSQILFFLPDALDLAGRAAEAEIYRAEYNRFTKELDTDQTRSALERIMLNRIGRQALITQIERSERYAERTRVNTIFAVLAAFIALLAMGFYINRQKRRIAERDAEIARHEEAEARTAAELARMNEEQAQKDAKIARQNAQLAIREKLDLLKNRETETNYARLEAQDEMQQKIGQELHDSVGATLSSVKLRLAPVEEVLDALPVNTRTQYLEANRLLSEACEELRRISHDLTSVVLMQLGLDEQLKSWETGIPLQVELSTFGLKNRLDFKIELNIFRTLQELVHNVIKHAEARTVTIQVNRFKDMVNLMVEDDGQGFDVEKIKEKPGLGLQSVAARVHDLNGVMQIDSRPGKGTTVSIDIPVKGKKKKR